MSRITIEIPEEAFLALKLTEAEMEGALRMAAAVKLFEFGGCPREPQPVWLGFRGRSS